MNKPTFTMTHETAVTVMQTIKQAIHQGMQSGPVVVTLSRETRSSEANSKLWAMLSDISKQVEHANTHFSPEDWKDILSAGYEEQRLVPGVNGNFVAIGSRTSKYTKKKMCEFVEYLYWFGAEKDVVWSEKAVECYEEWQAYGKQQKEM